MKIVQISVALCLAVAGSTVALTTASAHDPTTWYEYTGRVGKWDFSKDGTQISWAFTPDIPNDSQFKARIEDGASEWNAVTDVNRNLNKESAFNSNFVWDSCPDQREKNGVHYGEAGGGGSYAAVVIQCGDNDNDIKTANMQIDDDSTWYTGSGSVPSGQMDLWSVARHEFGHYLGFDRHWDADGSSSLCDSYPDNTMCSTLNTGEVLDSLGAHEKHTFQDEYPN